MEPHEIKKDKDTRLEVSRVPSKDPGQKDDLDLKPEVEGKSEAADAHLSERQQDRSQGSETIGIP